MDIRKFTLSGGPLSYTVLALAFLLFSAVPSRAQTVSLMAPALADVAGAVTARFGLVVEDLPILKGELEDGADMLLRCVVTLCDPSDYWADSDLNGWTFASGLKFDSLTKEFVMTLPGRAAPMRDKDLPRLIKQGWSYLEAPLGSWEQLERGEQYTLKIRTTLNEADAPDGFASYLFFWSWDIGTDTTFQLDFTY